MGPEIFPETTFGKHNPPCHLQMPTKALSCKKEAICEHGPEAPSYPVGQEEGDRPVCYKPSVQKPASLIVLGCISAYAMGSLHVLEGTMNAESYITFLEKHTLLSR